MNGHQTREHQKDGQRSRAEEERFFEEKGFARRIGFGRQPAVVVVDMQVAFTDHRDPAMLLASDADRAIEETNRILDAAHQSGIPVFFSMTSYEDEQLRDAGVWALKVQGNHLLREGTRAVELNPEIRRSDGDMVIRKKYPSAFFGTDLASRLAALGVDTIIITGVSTSGCVRATAVDGISGGFRPMVVREAVADRSRAAHEQSLFDLHAKYADVVGVEEVLTYFRQMGGDAVGQAGDR
jgi:nicotinamidase-related amidase